MAVKGKTRLSAPERIKKIDEETKAKMAKIEESAKKKSATLREIAAKEQLENALRAAKELWALYENEEERKQMSEKVKKVCIDYLEGYWDENFHDLNKIEKKPVQRRFNKKASKGAAPVQ